MTRLNPDGSQTKLIQDRLAWVILYPHTTVGAGTGGAPGVPGQATTSTTAPPLLPGHGAHPGRRQHRPGVLRPDERRSGGTLMPIRPSKLARTAGWTLVGLSLAGATIVALTPVTNGDNYCGRLYFDTVRNGACSSPMEVRTKVFIALAATSIVAGARLLVTARGTRILAVAALAILTVVLGLVSANRLLQPTSGAYCGSVLNRHRAHDAQIDGRCDALLRPGKRQAGLSFAAAALAGAVTAAGSRRLGPGWRLPS